MKLYYKPGACSMSARIVLHELGLPFTAEKVDTGAGLTGSGADYRKINPKGYVPALEIEGGAVLTENPAILQFLADSHPEAGLAPAPGTVERARLQEWLNFTASELHKAFSPYFRGNAHADEEKAAASAQLERRIGDVEHGLADGRSFVLGTEFSVADAYLAVVLNWTRFIGVELARWPHAAAYLSRVMDRASVQQAMREEGLLEGEVA